MGRGVAALATFQRNEPPAAGAITGANNGTSVSGSDVVLGQSVGAPGNPAELTALREIPIGVYGILVNATAASGLATLINGTGIQVAFDSSFSGFGSSIIEVIDNITSVGIRLNSFQDNADPTIIGGVLQGSYRIIMTNVGLQVDTGGIDFDTNVNAFHVTTPAVFSEETNLVRDTIDDPTPINLTRYNSGAVVNSPYPSGDLTVNLPPANSNIGVFYTVNMLGVSYPTNTVQIVPDGTDQIIANGVSGVSTPGAAIIGLGPGDSITLISVGNGLWIAQCFTGGWFFL